ncbi:MAG: hypothetical protein WCK32_09670 [Chlorobiaceae bacterium]
MNTVTFTPKTDIEEYLNNDFDIEIFDDLNEDGKWAGTFEPLEFLNLLYEQFEIVKANKEKPLSVKNHLLTLGLEKNQLFFLLLYLKHLIYFEADIQIGGTSQDNSLSICHDFIEKEYNKLDYELFPADENEPEKPVNKYDFDRVKNTLTRCPMQQQKSNESMR